MQQSIVLALAVLTGTFSGSYALQTGAPSVTSTLAIAPAPSGLTRLDFVQRRGSAVVHRYALDMTRLMHVIVVSDDFSSFAHLHPRLLPNGHFVVDAAMPPGPYRVYADSEPVGIGQQVFRFDVGANAVSVRVVPSGPVAQAGPYVVRLSAMHVRTGESATIGMTILKNGRPATDLEPYLGAAGHAVFVNARDYSYAHVHPMDADGTMPGMQMAGAARTGSRLVLHAGLHEPGLYELWFEFRGAGRLRVAHFVLTAD